MPPCHYVGPRRSDPLGTGLAAEHDDSEKKTQKEELSKNGADSDPNSEGDPFDLTDLSIEKLMKIQVMLVTRGKGQDPFLSNRTAKIQRRVFGQIR